MITYLVIGPLYPSRSRPPYLGMESRLYLLREVELRTSSSFATRALVLSFENMFARGKRVDLLRLRGLGSEITHWFLSKESQCSLFGKFAMQRFTRPTHIGPLSCAYSHSLKTNFYIHVHSGLRHPPLIGGAHSRFAFRD